MLHLVEFYHYLIVNMSNELIINLTSEELAYFNQAYDKNNNVTKNEFFIRLLKIGLSELGEKIVGKKICSKCHFEKIENEYYVRDFSMQDGGQCRECVRISAKNSNKKNPDKVKKRKQRYWLKHKPRLLKEHALYDKERKEKDPSYKLRTNISSKISSFLKKNGSSKTGKSCLNYMNFSIQELKEYLEKQFEPWMTWKNHGGYNVKTWNDNDQKTWTWQIDHIIPQSDLQYISMEDENFKKCWALENLRPYSAKLNILDGSNRTRHKRNK
jgi:hypothetical protein